jgi:hypothetical protein
MKLTASGFSIRTVWISMKCSFLETLACHFDECHPEQGEGSARRNPSHRGKRFLAAAIRRSK